MTDHYEDVTATRPREGLVVITVIVKITHTIHVFASD